VRVSNREAYVSPTRGAQGNALKTIAAMPFVLDGTMGRVDIATLGQRHEITFAVDQIRQEPAISREICPADVKTGTVVNVHWPDSACSKLQTAKAQFLQLADSYTFLNPHLTLIVDWFGEETRTSATNPGWKKWNPSEPTSAHWYSQEDFDRLVAAYIAYDQDRGVDRYVRELVKEFRGLTGTAKQRAVLEETGLANTLLSSLVNGDGRDIGVAVRPLVGAVEGDRRSPADAEARSADGAHRLHVISLQLRLVHELPEFPGVKEGAPLAVLAEAGVVVRMVVALRQFPDPLPLDAPPHMGRSELSDAVFGADTCLVDDGEKHGWSPAGCFLPAMLIYNLADHDLASAEGGDCQAI